MLHQKIKDSGKKEPEMDEYNSKLITLFYEVNLRQDGEDIEDIQIFEYVKENKDMFFTA